MHYLVTGGAGYIGSHMVKMLLEQDHEVTILDNLSTGILVDERARLIVCDLRNVMTLNEAFESIPKVDAVFQFAGLSIVSQSMQHPELYYDNNVCGTLYLLDAMVRHNVRDIIFSSSAAVYDELSPYGTTKKIVEKMLEQFNTAHGIRSASLRYFNAAGAAPDGTLGECHTPETHLIPNAINAALHGTPLTIYGDGSQVRDYVHVDDLCHAHTMALEHLQRTGVGCYSWDLGSGKGTTVNTVLEMVERLSNRAIWKNYAGERKGDPHRLVANIQRTQIILGWTPRYTLADIILHALAWHSKQ